MLLLADHRARIDATYSAVVEATDSEAVGMMPRQSAWIDAMHPLTLFGLFAVSAMLLCYALEQRSHWFILGFAVACALGSGYGFLQGAWPFGIVESIWGLVAPRRWQVHRPAMRAFPNR